MTEFDTVFAEQYGVDAIVIPEGARAADVIAYAEWREAFTYEGPNKVYVVMYPDRFPECYSEGTLRSDLRPKYTRDTAVPGLKIRFSSDDEIPEGIVQALGYDEPPIAGTKVQAGIVKIADREIGALNIRVWQVAA